MITYDSSNFLFIFQWRGSAFPRALRFAIPNLLFTVLLHLLVRGTSPDEQGNAFLAWNRYATSKGALQIWSAYTFVIGFLIVFRNSQAYNRFWEGATKTKEIEALWFNSASSLFAFCSRKETKKADVNRFQNLLVRLLSLLFCASLGKVADFPSEEFHILDLEGFGSCHMSHLDGNPEEKGEIISHWIQRLIMDATADGTLEVAPPFLARVFADLGNGWVSLCRITCIKEIQFPFPYAQMITTMLVVQWLVTPMIACAEVSSPIWAGIVSFFVVWSFWSLLGIAGELDEPFGQDDNDLPVAEMMKHFNRRLLILLHHETQRTLEYNKTGRASCLPQMKTVACLRSVVLKAMRQTKVGDSKATMDILTSQIPTPEQGTGSKASAAGSTVPSLAAVLNLRQKHSSDAYVSLVTEEEDREVNGAVKPSTDLQQPATGNSSVLESITSDSNSNLLKPIPGTSSTSFPFKNSSNVSETVSESGSFNQLETISSKGQDDVELGMFNTLSPRQITQQDAQSLKQKQTTAKAKLLKSKTQAGQSTIPASGSSSDSAKVIGARHR